MKLLTLSQLRFLGRSPWSTASVLLGITLGVASVVAVHLISLRVSGALTALTAAHLNELTHVAERPGLTADDYFALRQRWRRGELPGVTALLPMVEGKLVIGGRAVRVLGLDAFAGSRSVLALAALPPRGLVASRRLAQDLGIETHEAAGDRGPLSIDVPLPAAAGERFRIVGVFDGPDERLLLTDIGTAQELLRLAPTAISRVGVRLEHRWQWLGTLLDRVMPGSGAAFGAVDLVLPGWRTRGVDAELPSRAFAESVLFNLGALGSLALVVAWLLVFQTAVIWLRRRRRTMAMLTLQGVTSGELMLGFLGSLLPMALLATVIGLGLGRLLAALLSGIATAGLSVDVAAPALDGWVVAKAAASGVGVSLVGGYLAFRREHSMRARRPGVGAAVFGALLAAAVVGVAGVTALWGGFLAIVAVAAGGVLAVGPLLRRVRALARFAGADSPLRLLSRLGLRELVWYPRELAVAVGALALAVATSLAISLMVDSFRREFAAMLEQRLTHDVFVRGDGSDLTGTAHELSALSAVSAVSAYGRARVRVAGLLTELGYVSFDSLEARRYGLGAPLGLDEGIASERLLRELGLAVGDRVSLEGRRVAIVGSIPGFGEPVPRLIVDTATAAAVLGALSFDRLSILTGDPEGLADHLAAVRPELEVSLGPALRALALTVFDRTFAITGALTLLALLVAGIALYNALMALRINQQRTQLLLDAMGADAAERRRVELWRGLGIVAAVLCMALPLGLVMSLLLCQVINPRAFGWSIDLAVHASAVLPPLLTGVAVVIVTSLLPVPGERLGESLEGSFGGSA